MILSLCAASQTTLSVPSNPRATLIWRTISIVEGEEGVVDLSDGVLGRGRVFRPYVRPSESFVAASSSCSLLSVLMRLFGRSSGVEHAKARFLVSSALPFSSSTVLSSSAAFVHLPSSSPPLIFPLSQLLQGPSRLFAVTRCAIASSTPRTWSRFPCSSPTSQSPPCSCSRHHGLHNLSLLFHYEALSLHPSALLLLFRLLFLLPAVLLPLAFLLLPAFLLS
jgi:hypothetical protein